MDSESAAVALHYVPRPVHSIWTTTALTRAENHFRQNVPSDWDHLYGHAVDATVTIGYQARGTDIGPNGYDTDYDVWGTVDGNIIEQDHVELDENIASRFADRWAEKMVEVVGEAQEATTLSAKEFAAFVMMANSSCREAEAADALRVTVGTYRGKKGRIKSKRDDCLNTDILSRLLRQPSPDRFSLEREFGGRRGRIEATTPSEMYQEQIDAPGDSSLSLPRESPHERQHETYSQGHWRTAHVEGVDNVFATETSLDEEESTEIRIDFDGVGHGGADMHDSGENVQVSAWFTEWQARKLQKQLTEKLES